MKNKTLNNLKINLLITVISGLLNFICNKYFVKYMGTETLGLMRLFAQMISYLSLAELGISTASSYALYKPLLEKNIPQINLIVSTVDSFYKKIAFSIAIIGFAFSFVLPVLIENNSYGNYIYVYWILYVINTSIGYTFSKYPILFTANQEYGFVRKVQGIGRITFQILQIICLIKIASFTLFILIMICENIYNYYFYYRHYKKKYNYIKKIDKRDKSIIRDMKNLFFHKIASLIVYNTDYIILSKFVSLYIVGMYSSYLMISTIVLTFINIVTPVLIPKIGAFVAENSKDKIYNYWRELYSMYFFMASLLIVCTYNLIFSFIELWLGKDFLLTKITIVLILINLYIELTRGITDSFKISCGFFDDVYSPILEGIINLVFSLILVQKIGLNGVIIGTIISNIMIVVLLKPILVFKRCFDKNMIYYFLDIGKMLILSGTSILIIQFVITRYIIEMLLSISSWSLFIYTSLIVFIISVSITFSMFIIDKSFRGFIKKNIKIRGNENEKIFWNRWNKRRS